MCVCVFVHNSYLGSCACVRASHRHCVCAFLFMYLHIPMSVSVCVRASHRHCVCAMCMCMCVRVHLSEANQVIGDTFFFLVFDFFS